MPPRPRGNRKVRSRKDVSEGFYAQSFQPLEVQDLQEQSLSSLKGEISIMRDVIQRFYEFTKDQPKDLQDWSKAVSTLGSAATRLARLMQTHHQLEGGEDAVEQIRKALVELMVDIQPAPPEE